MGDRSIKINGNLKKSESGCWVSITNLAKDGLKWSLELFLNHLRSESKGLKIYNAYSRLTKIIKEGKVDQVFIPHVSIEGVYLLMNDEEVENNKDSKSFTAFLPDSSNTEIELYPEHIDYDALEKEYQEFMNGKEKIEP